MIVKMIKMIKLCTFVLGLNLVQLGQNSSTASACSLYLNQETAKDEMIAALATHFAVAATAIQRTDLTRVSYSFLAGLGADCSGLDQSIITSAFNFSATRNLQRCTFKGVIIQKNGAAVGEYFINDDEPVCTTLLRPLPLPLPLPIRPIRPIPHNN